MRIDIKLWDDDCCNYCPLMQEKLKKGNKILICNLFKAGLITDNRGRVGRLEKCIKENGKV